MPTLNWIGKDKVVNHHLDVPFYTLEHQYGFRGDKPDDKSETRSGNMIIHGDNLIALKALLPEFEGRVDCVYIDPPYNTGNEEWVYNDNVNDPRINKWLGDIVGKQGEDLSRDDKWLCMMYPRLRLLQRLLSDEGAIFISIDFHEQPALRFLCDEIFGSNNFIAEIACINKPSGRSDDKYVATAHESIVIYKKGDGFNLGGFSPEENVSHPIPDGITTGSGDYSAWAYSKGNEQRKANQGFRIDYFLISESLLPALNSSEILPEIHGSDHCPILIDIDVH